MTDYDELARFRKKSGNAGFRLRSVEQPAAAADASGNWRLFEEVAAQRVAGSEPHAVSSELAVRAPAPAPAPGSPQPARMHDGGAFSLGFVDDEAAAQRRVQLAGLFRRPEPTPGPAPSGEAPTLLKPLLSRIAARHG